MNVGGAAEQIAGILVGENQNQDNFNANSSSGAGNAILVLIGTAIILLALMLLFSKFLWNNCAVPLLNVNKCNSVWKIVGLSLLLGIVLPHNTKA